MTVLHHQVTTVARAVGHSEAVVRAGMVRMMAEQGYEVQFVEAVDPTQVNYLVGHWRENMPGSTVGKCALCDATVYHYDPLPVNGVLICEACGPQVLEQGGNLPWSGKS